MAFSRPNRAYKRDYNQLNAISSVVMYDTAAKRKCSRFYEVERIITRRKVPYDNEYLIKWKGWSLDQCTWEPSGNLTPDLLRNYENPPVSAASIQAASASFTCAAHSALRGQRTLPVYADMGLDVWRHIIYQRGMPSEHEGHVLLEKADLAKLTDLASNWWYVANEHGDGIQILFI